MDSAYKHISETNPQSGNYKNQNYQWQKLHFEQSLLGIIDWDVNFNIINLNPAAEKIFGYLRDELIGKSGLDILVPENDRIQVKNIWEELLDKKERTKSINKNIKKDGSQVLCSWQYTPLVNDKGMLIGISSFVEDITENDKSHKIQTALYEISEAVHRIEDINQLYGKIHTIIKGLMKAENFYIALYEEKTDLISFPYFVDEFDSPPVPCKPGKGLTEYVLKTGQNMLIDAELDLKLRNEGVTDLIGPPTEIWLGVALKIKNKPIGVIVVQDYNIKTTYGEEEKQILTYVSEQIASVIRKKMDEDKLKKYSEELKELNSSKDKFFSIIAHDLRSPFYGLLGLTGIMKNDFDKLSREELEAYINEIQSSTSNLFSLIENLLDWSRMQTGKYPYNPEVIKISEIVSEIVNVLQYNANSKSISINNDLKDQELYVLADEPMMRSLFQNLLSNAIKFTPEGGNITLSAEWLINDFVELSVKDTGLGISDENIPKLFRLDEFFSTPGTNMERGSGLGLMLCKDIIEKHGSELIVESKLGKGSRFSFKLPATKK